MDKRKVYRFFAFIMILSCCLSGLSYAAGYTDSASLASITLQGIAPGIVRWIAITTVLCGIYIIPSIFIFFMRENGHAET